MLIADACNNHLGDRRILTEMIKRCPADFIKFQLYDVKQLSWEWESEREYYTRHQLSDEDVEYILHECGVCGITPIFTLFSFSQAERAKGLGIQHVKVASPNAGINPLTEECSRFKTCVISTGMNTPRERVEIRREYPNAKVLYCISKYPCVWTERDREEALMYDGISDHSTDLSTALWAVRNGMWVERHYTLGKDLPGKDHKISSLPSEFQTLRFERDYLKKVESYKGRWNG